MSPYDLVWASDYPGHDGVWTLQLSTRCERFYSRDELVVLALGVGPFDPCDFGNPEGATMQERLFQYHQAIYSHAFALEFAGDPATRILLGTLADWPAPGPGLFLKGSLPYELVAPIPWVEPLRIPAMTTIRVVRTAGDRDFWIRLRVKSLAVHPKGGAAAQTKR